MKRKNCKVFNIQKFKLSLPNSVWVSRVRYMSVKKNCFASSLRLREDNCRTFICTLREHAIRTATIQTVCTMYYCVMFMIHASSYNISGYVLTSFHHSVWTISFYVNKKRLYQTNGCRSYIQIPPDRLRRLTWRIS